jgi:heme oxygenase
MEGKQMNNIEHESVIKAQSSAWFLVEELRELKKHGKESRFLSGKYLDSANKIAIALNELRCFMDLEAQKSPCED